MRGVADVRYDAALVDLLGVDGDLARHVPPEQRALARRHCRMPSFRVGGGWWDASGHASVDGGGQTLVMLDGLISRCVRVSTRESAELLGVEDVLQPGAAPDAGSTVAVSTRWRVHEPARFAVLDTRFHELAARWPGLHAELVARAVRRSGSLAVRLALAEIPSLRERLHLLLAHLCDRWGRVGPGGVELPLRLSQQTLADLTCATREAVNRNLAVLVADGTLDRSARGTWVLRRLPDAADRARAAGPAAMTA